MSNAPRDIILEPPASCDPAASPSLPSAPPPLICPFVVVVDTREQLPFSFAGFRADSRQASRQMVVPVQVGTLRSGDYSIAGHEERIALERKSTADLFQTIGRGRKRFERELARLNALAIAEVIVEADWHTVLTAPPPHTKLRPKTVFRSILAWKQRYRNVHWCFAGSRRLAEVMAFRTLERYWRTVAAAASAVASIPAAPMQTKDPSISRR